MDYEMIGALIVPLIMVIILILVIMALKKRQRFHQNGTDVDQRNVENYGVPVRSLYTSTKVMSIHHKISVTDDAGALVYRADSKVLTLHDYTTLYDNADRQIGTIKKKFFTIHETHYVDLADGTKFQISSEIFHLVKDVINIKELGWQIQGNILQLNFVIKDSNGKVIAAIGQKMLSLHDMFSIDIYDDSKEAAVIATLIALQHIIKDRETAEAIAAGAAGGSAHHSSSSSSH